jgi:ribosome maturation factor RimP
MRPVLVVDREHVEEEGLHVEVERLVVHEQLRQQAQIAAVDARGVTVHFEDREVLPAVDLRSGRVLGLAFGLNKSRQM